MSLPKMRFDCIQIAAQHFYLLQKSATESLISSYTSELFYIVDVLMCGVNAVWSLPIS